MAQLRPYFPLAAGVLTNLAVGLLYAWSVLVEPFELSLDAPRAAVSAAQSVALLLATIGTFVMHRLLRATTIARLALAMCVLAGAGLVTAGMGHSLPALICGYGLLFGFGSGVVYFTAMTAASIACPIPRSVAISINMSAIAIGGIIWSPVLTALVNAIGPHWTVVIAAAVIVSAGIVAFLLLTAANATAAEEAGAVGLFTDVLTDRPRIVIAVFIGFFFVSLATLAMYAHAATLLGALGAAADARQFAPILTSVAYVVGALAGGPLCDVLSGRRVLIGLAALLGAGLLALFASPSITVGLIALSAVGASLGAAASAHPVAITTYYGAAALPRVYGRLAIAYGVGGLLGPYAAGAVYDAEGGYGTVVIVFGVLALVGALAYACIPRTAAPTPQPADAD